MQEARPLYSEYTPMALWARVLAWCATAGVGLAILVAPPEGTSTAFQTAIVAGLLALGIAIEAIMGGLTVEVHRTELRLYLGRRGPIRKRVALERIRGLESVRYRPLRDFGGWGVRGFGARQAWTARGDRAVVLRLEGGTELFVGSDDPRRLEERIRTALNSSGVAAANAHDTDGNRPS